MQKLNIKPAKNILEFIAQVDAIRKEYWDANYNYKPYEPLVASKGKKFIKLVSEGSAWGFVAMFDGTFKGRTIKKGDLMKAASWSAPAAISRGNIFDGTTRFSYYGPEYVK